MRPGVTSIRRSWVCWDACTEAAGIHEHTINSRYHASMKMIGGLGNVDYELLVRPNEMGGQRALQRVNRGARFVRKHCAATDSECRRGNGEQ